MPSKPPIEIRHVGDMERLVLQPGDKFVLSVDERLTLDAQARIQAVWRQFAGKEVPLMILQPGMKLGAINVPPVPPVPSVQPKADAPG